MQQGTYLERFQVHACFHSKSNGRRARLLSAGLFESVRTNTELATPNSARFAVSTTNLFKP